MTWNPDGKQFAALTGEMLSVWSITPFREQRLGQLPDDVGVMVWSPVGNRLAMGSDDGTVCIWTLPRNRQ